MSTEKVALIAKRQNWAIAQQVVVLLEKGLGQEHSNMERRNQLLDKIDSRSIPDEVEAIDGVALIREDRGR